MKQIAGVDEAGRGPLAGPVIASAVILDPTRPITGLTDSKKLSAPQREKLAIQIQTQAIGWAIGEASAKEIDQYNILKATLLAMQRAITALPILPDEALIDGQHSPILAIPTQTIIRGDQLIPAISAASILAKVFRDEYMTRLHHTYPEYGFAQHKGYGTAKHLEALRTYGYIIEHRYSFTPVKRCDKRVN